METIGKEFAAALIAATAKIEGAIKDSRNPHFKTNYADLSSVIQAIKEPLTSHGITFIQRSHIGQDSVRVETMAVHVTGEMLSLGMVDVPVNKKDAQGYGSAMTYARRYGLSLGFGVPSLDDDGNAAVARAPKPTQEYYNSVPKQVLDAQPQKYYYAIPKEVSDEQSRFFKTRGIVWNDFFECYESPIDLGAKLADKLIDPNTGELKR